MVALSPHCHRSGTDIAVDAGEVILMQGDLRTIPLNFFWAYGYNVALIPLAAGVFYLLTD
nr:hypothetical protein [Thiocystis minor]